MGAWGHGHFEDDAALDFMIEIEAGDSKKTIADALTYALEVDYLDYDEGNAAIVSSAYIDRQVNGTKFSTPGQEEPLEVDTFPERHPDVELSEFRSAAVQALQKVLGDDSELNELWAENEELYPEWRLSIEQLINRLA